MSSILGNVANRIVFGVSSKDAKLLSEELDVPAENLRSPGQFRAIAQLMYDGEPHTFTLQPPSADSDTGLPVETDTVRGRMIEGGFWRLRSDLRKEDEERERTTRELMQNTPTVRARSPETKDKHFLLRWADNRVTSPPVKIGEGTVKDRARAIWFEDLAVALRAPLTRAAVLFRQVLDGPAATDIGRTATIASQADRAFELSPRLLVELGYGSLPLSVGTELLSEISEELDARVGTELSQGLSDQQLEEFELITDGEGDDTALSWIEAHLPGYNEVTRRIFNELKAEMTAEGPAVRQALQIADRSTIWELE
jgi:hypothetical protein